MILSLAGDGGSDRTLLPILRWSLEVHGAHVAKFQWVEFSRIPGRRNDQDKFRLALDQYPCDILFVHRDAEGAPLASRQEEIENAVGTLGVPHVPVVPVRMTEAWLLADEAAIRRAAGNPNGNAPLGLPALGKLEELPNPKAALHEAIIRASGLNARRRAGLSVHERVHRVAEYTYDFSPLKALPAFRELQQRIRGALPAREVAAQDA